jgi:hypothetical protein
VTDGLFHVPYRWHWTTVGRNVRSIWWQLVVGVTNLFEWMPIVWRDRDWDWVYLAKVLEFKFARMEQRERCGHHLSSPRHARQLMVAKNLCRRLIADEYQDIAERRFGETRRHTYRWMEGLIKTDQELLGKILGRHLREWWD